MIAFRGEPVAGKKTPVQKIPAQRRLWKWAVAGRLRPDASV